MSSFAFVIIPFIGFSLLLTFDHPPAIPLPLTTDSIDCQNVFPVHVSTNNSRILITVSVGNFIEFPAETAIRFLRVVTRTGDLIFEYPMSNFWDVNRSGANITFAILHGLAGTVHAILFCHTHPLLEFTTSITAVDIFPPGFSRSFLFQHNVARMNEICYSNGTIQYFTRVPSIMFPLRAAVDHVIPFSARLETITGFARVHPDHAIFAHPVFFVSAAPTFAWQQLCDVIIPLWTTVMQYTRRDLLRVYLARNQVNLVANIRRVIPAEPLLNDTVGCFAETQFLKTAGSVQIDQNATEYNTSREDAAAAQMIWTMALRPAVFASLRGLYTNRTMRSDRIVLDFHIPSLARQLEVLIPNATVVLLPQTDDLAVIADCLAQARLFVSAHATTVVFSIFLSPKASVLEIQPHGFGCTAFGHAWTRLVEVSYAPLRTSNCTKCSYTDLACYLREGIRYDAVTLTDLRQALLRLPGA